MTAHDGFGAQLWAEWTKLRSVRRWLITLGGAFVLSVLLSLLVAASSNTDYNAHPDFVSGPDGTPVADEFHFAGQTLTGDGTITAHVVAQANSQEWAGAGLMMKDGLTSGTRYAAVLVTPSHGVHMQVNYTTDIDGGAGGVGQWLRLTRTGQQITAYRSADGVTWQSIGSTDRVGLPATVQVGLFVSSPPKMVFSRQAGTTSVGLLPTTGQASFDQVSLGQSTVDLSDRDVRMPRPPDPEDVNPNKPGAVLDAGGTMTQTGDVYTLTGSGKIGPNEPDDDMVQVGLFGILAGIIALVAVCVLFMTSEYKRGLLRTTFTANPRRGRTLAAKAVVLGAVTFGIGLLAAVTAFFVTQPLMRDRGWAPPAFPHQSLADGPVLRAVLTTAIFVSAVALFSLGAAAVMRHSAAAITTVVGLVVLPYVLGSFLPAGAARWLLQLTPAGGFATMRAKPTTSTLADPSAMISPWAGLGIACVYAVVALAAGWWLLRRRDA